jgi:UDP-N-acetylglucosamine 1-carboxyvinyltransferase
MSMDMLIIEGGHKLEGELAISGSKNSSLPIIISTMLSTQTSVLGNVPDLADTRFLLSLLNSLGLETYTKDNLIYINGQHLTSSLAHYDVVRKMRASVLVLAPLLARCGHAKVSLPGGCAIGTRPVDIHLEGLKRLGAVIEVKEGYIHAHLPNNNFIGAEFELPLPSVGATENLIMAAVLAHGTTVLKRAAREPEIVELCEALNNAGAKISGHGTGIIAIQGVTSLNKINHTIRPDRVEAGSFIALAAATKSNLVLKNIFAQDLTSVLERFNHAGVTFKLSHQEENLSADLKIIPPSSCLVATDIETSPHPGFPTDVQAQFMAAMTLAEGYSTIYERVFENRMMHVPELMRMGALIEVHNGVAQVKGRAKLSGAQVMATDIRASASLVIAALCAEGKSEIRRVYHLDRGYEALEKKLKLIGANIIRCPQQDT